MVFCLSSGEKIQQKEQTEQDRQASFGREIQRVYILRKKKHH